MENINKRVRVPMQQNFCGVIARVEWRNSKPYGIQFDNARDGVLYWVDPSEIVYIDKPLAKDVLLEIQTKLSEMESNEWEEVTYECRKIISEFLEG